MLLNNETETKDSLARNGVSVIFTCHTDTQKIYGERSHKSNQGAL